MAPSADIFNQTRKHFRPPAHQQDQSRRRQSRRQSVRRQTFQNLDGAASASQSDDAASTHEMDFEPVNTFGDIDLDIRSPTPSFPPSFPVSTAMAPQLAVALSPSKRTKFRKSTSFRIPTTNRPSAVGAQRSENDVYASPGKRPSVTALSASPSRRDRQPLVESTPNI